MDSSSAIRRAIELSKSGDKTQARRLVAEVIQNDSLNAEAWVVMAQVVDSRSEAIECMRNAVRIRPQDEHARRYLEYLEKQGESEERISPFVIVAGMAALVALCLVGLFLSGRFPLPQRESSEAEASAITCRELIDQALKISNDNCQKIDRDEVCYGHTRVTADLKPGITERFAQTGDVLSIEKLTQLSAEPLNLDTRSWGVGILKLQANLPYTLPGQNVTIVVAGDTSILDHGETMQVFTFSSGVGGINCEKVPVDGLVVQMADGTGIRFQVNGSDLALSGDAVMQASPNGKMRITMINGGGWISSGGIARFFGQGETASVPLRGLVSDGPPIINRSTLGNLCLLVGNCGTSEPTRSPDDAVAMIISAVPEASLTPIGTPTKTPRPSSTPRPHPTATRTLTPYPIAVARPSATLKPTSTSAPASKPTDTPNPANTTAPTTATEASTSEITRTEPATDSPTDPPTATPTEDTPPSCSKISAVWRRFDGLTAQFSFYNNNSSSVYLSHILITWPQDNGELTDISFNGRFNSSEVTLPASPPSFSASVSGPHGMLRPSTITSFTDLEFTFDNAETLAATGYIVQVQLDIGCVLVIEH